MLQYLGHQRDTTFRGYIRQAHEPRVRHIVQVDQLSEVAVDRDQHPVQRLGHLQQRSVTGVGAERADLQHVVPVTAKRIREALPGAAIDQEPH